MTPKKVTEKNVPIHQKDLILHRVHTTVTRILVTDCEISAYQTDRGRDLIIEGYVHRQQIENTEGKIIAIARGVVAETENMKEFLETAKIIGITVVAPGQTRKQGAEEQ